MSEAKLLPCPFCGVTPAGPVDATRIEGAWNIIHRCEAIGPIVIARRDRETVVQAWNTRADLALDVEALRESMVEIVTQCVRLAREYDLSDEAILSSAAVYVDEELCRVLEAHAKGGDPQ